MVKKLRETKPKNPPGKAADAAPIKVLLIEDDPGDARLIREMLAEAKEARFEVSHVDRLTTGLDHLAADRLEVVLLDLSLPDSQGLETIIRAHHHALTTPIVVLTGFEDETLSLKAMQEGIQDYLPKADLNSNLLVRTIRYAIQRHHLLRDLEQKMETLQAGEIRFRHIIDENADGIVIVDKEGRVRFVNPAAEALFGRPAAELVGQLFGFPVVAGQSTELDIIRQDREPVVAETRVVETFWEDETVYLISLRNITERKQAEEALAEERNLLRTLIDNLPDYIYVKDTAGRFVIANKALARLVRAARPDELIGKTDYDFYPPTLAEQYCQIEQEVIRSGQPLLDREAPIIYPDGTEGWVLTTQVPLQDNLGKIIGLVGIGRDITERKQLEEQLRQSQKMEAVGRLAGGVAHDFNNLLTAITGYSELLLERHLNANHPLRREVEQIYKAGERAASLTRQLLAFSRRQVLQPKVLDLNRIVVDMEKMLRRLIGEDIELVTRLEPELGQVKADPGQVEQVIMNIAVNARDAMPHGGRLTIQTANIVLDGAYIHQHLDVGPGSYVMLAMSDTGHGMDPDTQTHLFEPFFTTKEQGKGTGLGLATVHGIVKQSAGHIWVYSEPGHGATFKIYLPRVEETAMPAQRLELQTPRAPASETILLVEDEDVVRELAARILQREGYTVLVAGHGTEALQISQQHQDPIHLLVTDVVMPGGMNGRQLAEHLASQHPQMKVLYMSGYTDEAIVHHGVLDQDVIFLEKPFTPNVLALKVHEALNSP